MIFPVFPAAVLAVSRKIGGKYDEIARQGNAREHARVNTKERDPCQRFIFTHDGGY